MSCEAVKVGFLKIVEIEKGIKFCTPYGNWTAEGLNKNAIKWLKEQRKNYLKNTSS